MMFSIPDECGDIKCEEEMEDPGVHNLVRLTRGYHIFKPTNFSGGVKKECPKPKRRFRKQIEEQGYSTQMQRGPSRPQRGVGEETKSKNIEKSMKSNGLSLQWRQREIQIWRR